MNQALEQLKQALTLHAQGCQSAMEAHFGRKPKWVVFLSACRGDERAHVACASGNQFETAFKAALDKLRKLSPYELSQWRWIKADLVTHIEAIDPQHVMERIRHTRSNFFRRGIAFDSQFNQAMMEQEINGIQSFPKDTDNEEHAQIRLERISKYLKNRRKIAPLSKDAATSGSWFLFDTVGYFYDASLPDAQVVALQSGGYGNGARPFDGSPEKIKELVARAGGWLAKHIHADGRFDYGFFAISHKPIPTYNILRHCSTLYAMLEAYELTNDAAILRPVSSALDYVMEHALLREGDQAFLVDHAQDNEVRLGAQAVLILAITKYTALTGDHRYVDAAQAAARAITKRFMDEESGGFVHVLSGIDLSLKEKFRIVYYDGEAVFALMRLYALDQNLVWLSAAKKAFDRFIATDHWKHHDHWLSYATGALTMIAPENRYFEFGLKNFNAALDFIEHRDTAYPTFLELLVAACAMTRHMAALGKQDLFAGYQVERLYRVTDHRARHQAASHFYPEMAMYLEKPGEIDGAFYTRHHSFRVRIDDIAHFISGYCQYYQVIVSQHKNAAKCFQMIKPASPVIPPITSLDSKSGFY